MNKIETPRTHCIEQPPVVRMDDAHGLIPASLIRSKICSDARLSKRAATLLRRECDIFGAVLLERAYKARATLGGPLEPGDLWEALLQDPDHGWLIDRLGLWITPGSEGELPPGVSPPPPPDGVAPDRQLPPLVWRRAPDASSGDPPPQRPLHQAFLMPRAVGPTNDDDSAPAPKPLNPLFFAR